MIWTVCLNRRSRGNAEGSEATAKDTQTVQVEASSFAGMVAEVRQQYSQQDWHIDDSTVA